MVNHSAREVEKITKEEAKGPHPVQTKAPKIERYEWLDKDTGKTYTIPKGIDPGWDYNVGKSGFRD
ncbi:hypothetical protein KAW18_18315 [candidate division WOR-3 bacterium]|nr:hypothetical protein [candidate division WOR-3 bacterium]